MPKSQDRSEGSSKSPNSSKEPDAPKEKDDSNDDGGRRSSESSERKGREEDGEDRPKSSDKSNGSSVQENKSAREQGAGSSIGGTRKDSAQENGNTKDGDAEGEKTETTKRESKAVALGSDENGGSSKGSTDDNNDKKKDGEDGSDESREGDKSVEKEKGDRGSNTEGGDKSTASGENSDKHSPITEGGDRKDTKDTNEEGDGINKECSPSEVDANKGADNAPETTSGDADKKADDSGGKSQQLAINDLEISPHAPDVQVDKAPSVAGTDDTFPEDDLDDELDVDLEKPWVKPCLKKAQQARKRSIWNQGMRSYCHTSINEIGYMGVGMYLYFWVIRIVALVFLGCALLSVPAMVLNFEGNAGMSIAETDVDSLRLVSLSYGNQGLNLDLVGEAGCSSSDGTVDCTGNTVQVFGETKEAVWVGYILAGMEIGISLFFVAFIIILNERLEAKIEEIDDANVTPADYSVMVRGLPPDATKEEVRKHFDDLYTLVTPGPSYPFLGISTTGVGVFWSCTLGVLFGLLVTPSVVERAGVEGGAAAVGVGFVTVFGCMFAVYATVKVCRIGRPRRRETPSDEWRKGRKQRKREQNRAKKTQGGAKSGSKYHATAKVLPVEETRALGASDGDDASKGPSKGAMVGEGEPGMMEAGGVVEGAKETGVLSVRGASQENNRDFSDARPPDPLPCQSCLNSRDKSFIGSWVADIVLGNPVGEVLRGFMDQEESLAKVRKARTVVRQMKTLGKAKKLAKAEAELAKLKAGEEALISATRKKQNPADLDKVSVAFVTFEHDESKKRCLEDYRYSRRGFCRRFQPAKLQFCRIIGTSAVEGSSNPEGKPPPRRKKAKKSRTQKWPIKVFQAPEPSDVKWENLDVSPMSRKLRRAVTSLVCVVLLIVSFIIIYLAQNEQVKFQQQIPALDTCEEAIPAVIFGTYDFPSVATLQRNERRDETCEEGSFYLTLNPDVTNPNARPLNYSALPPIFSASGDNVSRDVFESTNDVNLCDASCQPTSGGVMCPALSCVEESWQAEGHACVAYSASTIVGCFCLDAVVTSLQENGLVNGARQVATEQGAICTPFLKDYAKANAFKILAVLPVVIVNTLLTSVMAKLANFERHVSLSDYISTVTAKLALAQFLNTALIVIIVNAGYSGGGSNFLQDIGVLSGEYTDFERNWYATVGVAVAMSMLINVIVPHVQPLVGQLIVEPIKRLLKRKLAATQTELNQLYKPPKFNMETRYAFLLQVVGVSMLYSGGIPVLYLFASFSFATNFLVDKLWIIKLAQQPPMYTAALARMFVGVLPIALFMHMAVTCYMLGNSNILQVGFASQEAEDLAKVLQEGGGLPGLVADHVLRKHVFPLFVVTAVMFTLYVVYKIVGDPVLRLIKLVLGILFRCLFGWMCKKKPKASVIDQDRCQPGFTADYFRMLKKGERLDADEKSLGWVVCEDGKRAKWLFTDDASGPRGVKAKSGVPRQTWQAIAELGQYNYVMEESDACGEATRYMAMAGFLSPRMKEKENARRKKADKFAMTQSNGVDQNDLGACSKTNTAEEAVDARDGEEDNTRLITTDNDASQETGKNVDKNDGPLSTGDQGTPAEIENEAKNGALRNDTSGKDPVGGSSTAQNKNEMESGSILPPGNVEVLKGEKEKTGDIQLENEKSPPNDKAPEEGNNGEA